MAMVIGRESADRALILPAMPLHMAIGKGHNSASIMRTVGKVEKRFLVHIDTKVRPANAVGIDILKEKHSSGH